MSSNSPHEIQQDWIIRPAPAHPARLPWPGVNPPRLCPVAPSLLALRSVLNRLREPGTNGPDDPGVVVHGPADLEWSRADCAAIREDVQAVARDFIAAGADFPTFVDKCTAPSNDLTREWLKRERMTRGELRDLWDGERQRLAEPSPRCNPDQRERFWRKRDGRNSQQRKVRDIALRISMARL